MARVAPQPIHSTRASSQFPITAVIENASGVASGAGLVFPDKRKAHGYLRISAWCTYSFASFSCCLSILNAPFPSAILVEEKTSFFRYSALLSHHNMFRLHCGGWGIDRLLPIRTNKDYETAPKNCIVC